MNPKVRRVERLVRVRKIQHALAAAKSEAARRRVAELELSAERLSLLRGGFGAGQGLVDGAALASLGEFAMRLDVAREGLTRTIGGARIYAERLHDRSMVARRDRESAERLGNKAVRDAVRALDRKQHSRRTLRRGLSEESE